MADFKRDSFDMNSDLSQLLAVLNSMEEDLQKSYVQRKGNESEELEVKLDCAYKEITQRENDLKAALGIAKIFIENGRQAEGKLKAIQIKVTEESDMRNEICRLKEEVAGLEDRYHEVSHCLEKTEDELAGVSREYHRLMREKSKEKDNMSLDSISLDRFSAEISDMNHKFREEFDVALSKIYIELRIEAENKSSKLQEQLINANQAITKLEYQLARANKSEKHKGKHNNLTPAKLSSISVKSDASDTEFYLDVPRSSMGSDSTNLNASRSSFNIPVKSLEISSQDRIAITGNNTKSSITDQEFFNKTVYVVKCNTPYAEDIEICCESLYRLAVSNKIPLHKWHLWIESQLNAIYIKNSSRINQSKPRNPRN